MEGSSSRCRGCNAILSHTVNDAILCRTVLEIKKFFHHGHILVQYTVYLQVDHGFTSQLATFAPRSSSFMTNVDASSKTSIAF